MTKKILLPLILIVACSSSPNPAEEGINNQDESIHTSKPLSGDENERSTLKLINDQGVDSDSTPIELEEKKVAPIQTENKTQKPVKKVEAVHIAFAQLIRIGKKVPKDYVFDIMGDAFDSSTLYKKGECGADETCGKLMVLENLHEEYSLELVVEAKIKEDDLQEMRLITLSARQLVEVGCTKTCGEEAKKVSFEIISAKVK